jgi:tRNA(Ile)-lysidine synthase
LFYRPLLEITREQTEAACGAEGIPFWSDPHNCDPRFTRSRIRHRVLPMLEAEVGPGVAAALARTADMVRADVEALDRLAGQWFDEHRLTEATGVVLDTTELAALDEAIRLRVLRLAAVAAGCPAGELFRVHVLEADRLVRAYTGQRRIELPGPVHAVRAGHLLRFLQP